MFVDSEFEFSKKIPSACLGIPTNTRIPIAGMSGLRKKNKYSIAKRKKKKIKKTPPSSIVCLFLCSSL